MGRSRILIVEDENITVEYIRKILESREYEVLENTDTGEDAINAIKRVPPDLVLMDIMLAGELDGIDTAAKIQADFDIPVIFLTADMDESSLVRAKETAPYGFLIKPVGEYELYTSVETALNRHRLEKKIKESEEFTSNLLDNSPNPIIVINPDKSIRYVNPALEKLTGFKSDNLIGIEPPYPWWSDSLAEDFGEYFPCVDERGIEKNVEMFKKENGNEFWVEISSTQVRKDDELIFYVSNWIDITAIKLSEDALKGRTHDLNERLKELNCLYEISSLANKPAMSFEKVMQGTVGIISRSWQYPEIACARIVVEEKEFSTTIFCETDWKQSSDIILNDKNIGFVEVCYIEERPPVDEGPFMKEERNLINAISEMISQYVDKKASEEKIKQLSNDIMKSQEEERQRIAKDLHDSVSQTILAAKLSLKEFEKNPDSEMERFSMGIDFIDKAAQELREIYTNIYPSILSDIGLEATIEWYAKNYLEMNNINVKLRLNVEEEIDQEIKVNLYRIVQELFSNIVKHSGADSVRVGLSYENDKDFVLSVGDNGLGFNYNNVKKGQGFGLSNIRQRAEYIGANIIMESEPGEGALISVLCAGGRADE